MILKIIPAVKARIHLGEIMKKVFKKEERVIVEKSGIPMVAILSADEYRIIVQEREERFKILDRIKAKIPNISSQEIEDDVTVAVKSVRKHRV